MPHLQPDTGLAMDIGRRDVIIGGAAAALLVAAGCSGSSGEATDDTSTTSGGGRDEPTTRDIDTPAGAFTIPLDPRKVVAIEPRLDVEAAVAFGLPITAIGGNGGDMSGQQVAPWVPLPDPDVPVLGGVQDDLEAIIAVEPDLIVCNTGAYDLDALATVAPLLAFDFDQPWRDIVDVVGGLLGRPDDLDALIADFDAERDTVVERHAAALADRRIAIISPTLDGSFAGAGTVDSPFIHLQVLADLGGAVVPFLEDKDWAAPSSFEQLSEISDADAIMVVSLDEDRARNGLAGIGPWTDLPAVQGDRVHYVDGRLNFGLIYTAYECLRQLDTVYGLID